MSITKPASPTPRDTKWVEGVRGLAAVLVMTSHLALAYFDYTASPRSYNQPPRWYNLPLVRVIFEGSPFVSVFIILTGFVNALKPIRQARTGDVSAVLSGLASSCFRRSLRLMLPCTVITVICAVLAEMGGFKTASMVMSHWLVTTSAKPSVSWWAGFVRLLKSLFETWAFNTNELERNQWAMMTFLKGSLAVYVFILAAVRVAPRWRMSIAVGLVVYGWIGYDTSIFMPIFTGVFLAELSMTPASHFFSSARSLPFRLLPYIPLLLGWYLISYPTRYPNRMPWSRNMRLAGEAIFPQGADVHTYWNEIGVTLIIGAIMFSSSMQRFFNLPVLQWLGARSFPIYLVHGPLLRSFHTWMVFAGERAWWIEQHDDEGKVVDVIPMFRLPEDARYFWTIPIFLVATFFLADLWYENMDPYCGEIAQKIETRLCGERSEPTRLVGKIELQDCQLVETSMGSPLSRATTPMNEIELVLPR